MQTASQWIRDGELPAPKDQPVPVDDAALRRMSVFDQQLLAELSEGEAVLYLVRTRTKTDVGLWFRQAALWLACVADDLLVFVHGPEPVRERLALAGLRGSFYNHVTGDLVLAEAGSMEPLRTLRLEVDDALQVLAQIFAMEED